MDCATIYPKEVVVRMYDRLDNLIFMDTSPLLYIDLEIDFIYPNTQVFIKNFKKYKILKNNAIRKT